MTARWTEIPPAKKQLRAVAKALEEAGPDGLTGLELFKLTGSMRYGARIKELRDEYGYVIEASYEGAAESGASIYRYKQRFPTTLDHGGSSAVAAEADNSPERSRITAPEVGGNGATSEPGAGPRVPAPVAASEEAFSESLFESAPPKKSSHYMQDAA